MPQHGNAELVVCHLDVRTGMAQQMDSDGCRMVVPISSEELSPSDYHGHDGNNTCKGLTVVARHLAILKCELYPMNTDMHDFSEQHIRL